MQWSSDQLDHEHNFSKRIGPCPELTRLDLTCPELTCPDLTWPVLSPDLTFPEFTFPGLTCLDLHCPHLTCPNLTSPDLTWPVLAWPFLTWPSLLLWFFVLSRILFTRCRHLVGFLGAQTQISMYLILPEKSTQPPNSRYPKTPSRHCPVSRHHKHIPLTLSRWCVWTNW